jgi:hypothetical protein
MYDFLGLETWYQSGMAVHFLDQLPARIKMINRLKMFAKLCSDRILMTLAHQSEDGGGHVDRNDSLLTRRKKLGRLLSEAKRNYPLRFGSYRPHKSYVHKKIITMRTLLLSAFAKSEY